jgi:hypothetical protein
MTKTALLIAATLISAPFAASATTILDGGFETKGAALPVTDYCYDGFATPGGPACASSPWVGGGVIITNSGPWGGTAAASGSYYGFVQGTQIVSQTFTATANSTGIISWVDTNRTNNGGPQSYEVSISDGITTTNIGTYTSAVGAFVGRTSSSFALTNGTAYTLSFTGLAVDDRTAFIDNVSIATTAVPEASTWAMLLAGFGLVGLAARRRSAAVAA